MITNPKVRVIERLHNLSKNMATKELYEQSAAEFSELNKKFLGVDLVGVLLDEINFLETVRENQAQTITDLSVYKWKYEGLNK